MMRLSPYPDGKAFAFTIVDDTDGSTLETIRPVYEHLHSLGLRTTKTVWIRPPATSDATADSEGDTLQRAEYREYVESLQASGFEIALHNVAGASSRREEIISGIDEFCRIFGHEPKIHIQHEKNRDNLYFDVAQDARRLPSSFRSRPARAMHSLVNRWLGRSSAEGPQRFACCGEEPESEYFWGDVCQSRIKYVRSNVFLNDLNTIRRSPQMPFHLARTPFVNYWFDSSNGGDRERFDALLSERQVSRLARENGCSVLYTHFGRNFTEQTAGCRELNRETRERLGNIASRGDGWFAPAGELLDRLLAFQRIAFAPFSNGALLHNSNPFDVCSCSLWETPNRRLYTPAGQVFTPNAKKRLTLPSLKSGATLLLLDEELFSALRPWNGNRSCALAGDMASVWRKLRELLPDVEGTLRRMKAGHA
ncbi:MAG: hypothetical protein JST93_02080 [Acidobacteria bacterium]|nr:hypothetical protein [Acidobacteriota bacterium]